MRERERDLELLGHMMLQTKHWTLKYTDLYLESALVWLKCQNTVILKYPEHECVFH